MPRAVASNILDSLQIFSEFAEALVLVIIFCDANPFAFDAVGGGAFAVRAEDVVRFGDGWGSVGGGGRDDRCV
jgi:hypothetical protein